MMVILTTLEVVDMKKKMNLLCDFQPQVFLKINIDAGRSPKNTNKKSGQIRFYREKQETRESRRVSSKKENSYESRNNNIIELFVPLQPFSTFRDDNAKSIISCVDRVHPRYALVKRHFRKEFKN